MGRDRDYRQLIADAVAQSERLQQESRLMLGEVRASTRALELTVDEVRRRRAERGTFGNRHDDAREAQPPG